jgi:hypothetical protein
MAEILVSSYSINNRSLDHAGADAGVVRLRMLLIANALVWTISAWLFRSNLDWAGDMLENYVWGIEWQMGYFKHPPLFAWMAGAWFSVFPRTNLAYFALSNVNALIGLCGIVALARRFVPAREAAVAGLAMAVSPIYTTLAIKFNANTVLLSLWRGGGAGDAGQVFFRDAACRPAHGRPGAPCVARAPAAAGIPAGHHGRDDRTLAASALAGRFRHANVRICTRAHA